MSCALKVKLIVIASLTLSTSVVRLHAQNSDVTDPNQAQGVHSYQTYDGVTENINLQSGNLHLCVMLVSLPGRNGHDLNVPLCYNSQFNNFTYEGAEDELFVTTEYVPGALGYTSPWTGPGWSLIGPLPISYYSSSNVPQGNFPTYYTTCAEAGYTVITSDGTAHQFPAIQQDCVDNDCEGEYSTPPTGCVVYSDPGAAVSKGPSYEPNPIVADVSSNVLYMPDSTKYQGGQLLDTNGNAISGSAGPPWTDSIGRQVTLTSGASNSTVITYPGSNGNETVTLFPNYIVLPNGLTYTVQSDADGELTKITYPSGGYTRYVYTTPSYQPLGTSGPVVSQKFVCPAPAQSPGATSVSSGNTCPVSELETDYYYTAESNWNSNTTATVVDPAGNETVYTFAKAVGGSYSIPPVEIMRQIYTGNTYRSGSQATLLRTIQTQYSTNQEQAYIQSMPNLSGCTPLQTGGSPLPTVPTCVLTILENGMTSMVVNQWNANDLNNSLTDLNFVYEYDFGANTPGSLLRETYTEWLNDDIPGYASAVFGGGNVMNRQAKQVVYDGSGNILSQIVNTYDNGASSGPGNLTKSQTWRNTDGAWLATNMQYDGFGNVTQTQDPNGNVTQYGYADNYTDGSNSRNSNAYQTSVTIANHTTTHQYYYGSGLVAATCGPNFGAAACSYQLSNKADYEWYQYDTMGRAVQATRGDGGTTRVCYSETGCGPILSANQNASPAPSTNAMAVTTMQTVAAGTTQITTEVLDGLGRAQNQLTSDPSCTTGSVEVDTGFDGEGRVATVSNTYCSPVSGAPMTRYQYDGLGRLTTTIHPDGSAANDTYWGRAVEVQDEGNGNGSTRITRIVQSDALGRQRGVCEVSTTTQQGGGTPIGCGLDIQGNGFVTSYSYQYDPSTTNLKFTVSQPGLNSRIFEANSLGLLSSATNPESGTVTYGYDNDGNLTTRTDARNVVSHYTYDALSRLTSKWYQNEQNPTSTACFVYDQSTNGSGRLSSEWTEAGGVSCPATPPSSGILTRRQIPSYDLMGNVTTDQQCAPPLNCSANNFYTFSYAYDQAQNVIYMTNGLSGASSQAYWKQYDVVDRLCWLGLQQPTSGCSSPNSLYAVQSFNPSGGVVSATFGPSISQQRSYHPTRLWPVSETDLGGTVPGTATIQLTGSDQMSAFSYGSVTFSGVEQGPVNGTYDNATFVIYIGSGSNTHTYSVGYGQSSTPQTLATGLAQQITCSTGPVRGTVDANGVTVDLTSCSSGTNTNYPLSSWVSQHPQQFSQYSFTAAVSGSAMQPIITLPQINYPTDATFSGTGQSGVTGSFNVLIFPDSGGPPAFSTTLSYSSTDTATSMASRLAGAIGSCSGSQAVGATVAGSVVTLVSCQSGNSYYFEGNLNYQSGGSSPVFTLAFTSPQYAGVTSGAVYDSGTVVLNVNGAEIASINYGSASTPATIASGLASAASGNSAVNVSASGSNLALTALGDGTGTDYSYLLMVNYNTSAFSSPSFGASDPSGTLSGGQSTQLYSWSIPTSGGYAGDGNVHSMNDSVMGTWNYGYDDMNRLNGATATAGSFSGMNLSWGYDQFGNRWYQQASGGTGNANQPNLSFSGGNNHIDNLSYDAAGDLLNDTFHNYTYDAENRLSSVDGISYVYDAEGHRVAKISGSTVTNTYLLDLNGGQVTELDGNGNWIHTNLFADQKLLATYLPSGSSSGYHYRFTDWLGTLRVQARATGAMDLYCTSYPFGDGQDCTGTLVTEHFFTGKEHDAESGLDYFLTRYYSSIGARFLTPDPSGHHYADIRNPQNLNLYSYALNNPLRLIDPTGLGWCYFGDPKDPNPSTDASDYDMDSQSEEECKEAGGQYHDVSATVNVNADDTGTVDTVDTGSAPPNSTVPQTLSTQHFVFGNSFADCLRSGNEGFSLQAGLQKLSGGRLGNGAVSSALLGNSVQSAIDVGQKLTSGDVSGGVHDYAQDEAIEKGVEAGAKALPTVSVSASVTVGSSSGSATVSAAATVPFGTIGETLLKGLSRVKLPYDLSVASFSAVVCSIGR